jgi:LPS sulfotransferase NodH
MPGPPRSYLICGTPRTGSTLLCSLLASTGVLGQPASFFREPDEAEWAATFGLASAGGRVLDYRAFVRAAREAGASENGVFGGRVMWGSLDRLLAGLGRAPGQTDLAVLEAAFGPLAFVHLRREDIVGQAVSWSRAEQTGYWQQDDVAVGEPRQDLAQMRRLLATIQEHNAAWEAWFGAQGVAPLVVTYEQLVADRRQVIQRIAAAVGVALPEDWSPDSPHRKQADDVNRAWVEALRAAIGG